MMLAYCRVTIVQYLILSLRRSHVGRLIHVTASLSQQGRIRLLSCFLTTRVRSTTGGSVFTGVCLLTQWGGGGVLQSQVLSQISGPRSFPGRGGWYPPAKTGLEYPLPGMGYPPGQDRTGVHPLPSWDWVNPPPPPPPPRTGYVVGGMPLAVSRGGLSCFSSFGGGEWWIRLSFTLENNEIRPLGPRNDSLICLCD